MSSLQFWLLIIEGIAILVLLIFLLRSYIKGRQQQVKVMSNQIPQDVTDLFNKCEAEIKKDNSVSPYEILYRLTQNLKGGIDNNGTGNKADSRGGTSTIQEDGSREKSNGTIEPSTIIQQSNPIGSSGSQGTTTKNNSRIKQHHKSSKLPNI